jgi:hypothetical protein
MQAPIFRSAQCALPKYGNAKVPGYKTSSACIVLLQTYTGAQVTSIEMVYAPPRDGSAG